MTDLGRIIKAKRLMMGLSRNQVANLACVNPITLKALEENMHSIGMDSFLSIADAVGLEVKLKEKKNNDH